eukprot:5959204-Alexandrium_andersonii.AAC.1
MPPRSLHPTRVSGLSSAVPQKGGPYDRSRGGALDSVGDHCGRSAHKIHWTGPCTIPILANAKLLESVQA